MEKTLLIVDDEPAIVAALTRVLRNRGFNIRTANSAQEALDMMQHTEVCVVLSDYQMPQMNGLQLLKQIAMQWPQTKRLMLTGNNDNPEALRCEAGKATPMETESNENNERRASVDITDELNTRQKEQQEVDVIHQILSKPWSTEQLTQAIEQAFGSQAKSPLEPSAKTNSQFISHSVSQNANHVLLSTLEEDELVNQNAIEQLAADVSEQMFPELAALFIESTEQRLGQLEQVDRLQLKCAVPAEVRLQLHTLASSMALYGLVHCAQSARYLEHATESEVQRQLGAFCEKTRQSLDVFNQLLIRRVQSEI